MTALIARSGDVDQVTKSVESMRAMNFYIEVVEHLSTRMGPAASKGLKDAATGTTQSSTRNRKKWTT